MTGKLPHRRPWALTATVVAAATATAGGVFGNIYASQLGGWWTANAWWLFLSLSAIPIALTAIQFHRGTIEPTERQFRRRRRSFISLVEAGLHEMLGSLSATDHPLLEINTKESAGPGRPKLIAERVGGNLEGERAARKYISDDAPGGLLILGKAGGGKTTWMAQWCLRRLKEAKLDADVACPVLLSLSSWQRADQNILSWAAKQISDQYRLSRTDAESWLSEGVLNLALDGLDELDSHNRSRCVAALNAYLRENPFSQILVTCRDESYKRIHAPVQASTTIELILPTQQAAAIYLESLPGQFAAVASAIPASDTSWWRLARTPLFLGIIATISSQGRSIDLNAGSPTSLKNRLIDAYIELGIARRSSLKSYLYSPSELMKWAAWLAWSLQTKGSTNLRVDSPPRNWVELVARNRTVMHAKPIKLLRFASTVSICLLLLYAASGSISLFVAGSTILAGTLFSWVTGYSVILGQFDPEGRIEPIHSIRPARYIKIAGRTVASRIVWAALSVVPVATTIALLSQTSIALHLLTAVGVVAMVVFFSIVEPVDRLPTSINELSAPESLRRSRRCGLIYGATLGLLAAAIAAVSFLPIHGLTATITVFIMTAPTTAIIGWLRLGGAASLQHLSLRQAIARNGLGPLDYMSFIDQMTAAVLVRQVGSEVQFVHSAIQSRLASHHAENKDGIPTIAVH